MRPGRGFIWLGALVVVAGCSPSARTTTTTSAPFTQNIAYDLPEGWQAAASDLMPNVGDPEEVLSAGTFTLRPGGNNCAHMPEAAMEDMGPEDVMISLQERRSPEPSDFTPRPASFGPVLTGVDTFSDAFECMEASERADVGVLVWLPFKDAGRGFYLLIAMGTDTSDEVRLQTVELLDSLRFGPEG